MKVQTMSVVVGTAECNAKCPFCVSKTTPKAKRTLDINVHNLRKAKLCALRSNVQTILLTGKGEPTLFPEQISQYVDFFRNDFPFIELQTNGIWLATDEADEYLKHWYNLGLNTICLSVVDFADCINREIYQPDGDYMNHSDLVKKLHTFGFTVRLSCMMLDQKQFTEPRCVHDWLCDLLDHCRELKIKQLTVRPIAAPENKDNRVTQWIKEHTLTPEQMKIVSRWFEDNGTQIMRLAHGSIVYDVDGQNVCWSNCLTDSTDPEDIRQLIFFPDGTLAYDWRYKGAILL